MIVRDTYQQALQAQQLAFRVLLHQDKSAPQLEFADSFGALQVLSMMYFCDRAHMHSQDHSMQCDMTDSFGLACSAMLYLLLTEVALWRHRR